MKIGGSRGYQAMEYEHVAAVDSAGFRSRKLYAVVGLPGVFRQVAEPKGEPADAGCVVAFYDGGLLYLSPDPKINLEAVEGGMTAADRFDGDGGGVVRKLAAARAQVAAASQSPPVPSAAPEPDGAAGGQSDEPSL